MFLFLPPLMTFSIGYGSWILLRKTKLPRTAQMLLSLLVGIIAASLLYRGTIYLSIFAFLANDPITW